MVQESSSAHAVHTIIKIKTSTKHAKSAQTYTIKKNIKKPKNSLYSEKVFSLSKPPNSDSSKQLIGSGGWTWFQNWLVSTKQKSSGRNSDLQVSFSRSIKKIQSQSNFYIWIYFYFLYIYKIIILLTIWVKMHKYSYINKIFIILN